MKPAVDILTCQTASALMSPFIDSMTSAEESDSLGAHLAACAACDRQWRSLVSMRRLLAASHPAPVPEDLALAIRVRLSHARARDWRARWQARMDNILKPAAVPAAAGVLVTMVCFVVLLGGLFTPRAIVAATDAPVEGPAVALYEPPETTTPTLKRFGAAVITPDLDQAISVQTEVSDTGRIYDFSIIAGTRSAGVDRWLQEQLLLAQFRPATNWGVPVPSRIILSFVNVRG
jgi:anti-sigma factor RsiW